jgi:hypothetical protein
MVAFTLVLVTYVWRLRADRPCEKQVELFKWWPQALRPKEYKTNTTTETGTSGHSDGDESDSATVVSPVSSDLSGTVGEKAIGKTKWGGRGKWSMKTKTKSGTRTKFGSVPEGIEYTEKEIRGAKILLVAISVATFFIFIR